MSVDSTSLPQPGFYASPSLLPSGLASGSATAPGPGASGASAGTSGATAAQSTYQQSFDNLMQADTAELMSVSFGSAQSAQSNVASVLAQASALQQQQIAAQQQAAADASSAAPSIQAPVVPTMASIVQASNGAASSDLSNGTLGASIDTTA
jgi:hypothetical protein